MSIINSFLTNEGYINYEMNQVMLRKMDFIQKIIHWILALEKNILVVGPSAHSYDGIFIEVGIFQIMQSI